MKYTDELAKLEYYKQRIINSALENGIYPSDITVSEKLKDIDTKLSVFRANYVKKGDSFDTDEFNTSFILILADLRILYQLVYKLCIKQLEKCRSYVDLHLEELESMAKRCKQKSKFEVGSSYLGKTLYFASSNFSRTDDKVNSTFSLGEINFHKGSKVACLVDSDTVSPEKMLLRIGNAAARPYNYNKDYIKIAGQKTAKTYDCVIDKNIQILQMPEITADKLTPSLEAEYVIYSGKGYMNTTTETITTYSEFKNIYSADKAGRVQFFVLNAHYINFDFSMNPTTKNFDGNLIDSPSTSQQIIIDYPSGFNMNVDTDGVIYACKRDGIVTEGKLYYPEASEIHDYKVFEYKDEDNTEKYTCILSIDNSTGTPPDIKSITIKELADWRE